MKVRTTDQEVIICIPVPRRTGESRAQLQEVLHKDSAALEWITETLERVMIPSNNLKYLFQINAYLGEGQDREEAPMTVPSLPESCRSATLPSLTEYNSQVLLCNFVIQNFLLLVIRMCSGNTFYYIQIRESRKQMIWQLFAYTHSFAYALCMLYFLARGSAGRSSPGSKCQ